MIQTGRNQSNLTGKPETVDQCQKLLCKNNIQHFCETAIHFISTLKNPRASLSPVSSSSHRLSRLSIWVQQRKKTVNKKYAYRPFREIVSSATVFKVRNKVDFCLPTLFTNFCKRLQSSTKPCLSILLASEIRFREKWPYFLWDYQPTFLAVFLMLLNSTVQYYLRS